MKNIYIERNKLLNKSMELRNIYLSEKYDKKAYDLRETQNEMYQKYKFFDNYIKAKEKIK